MVLGATIPISPGMQNYPTGSVTFAFQLPGQPSMAAVQLPSPIPLPFLSPFTAFPFPGVTPSFPGLPSGAIII